MKRKAKSGVNRCWPPCLIAIWVSCATQRHLVLEPVGPRSASGSNRLALAGSGFLKVYSATETRHVGKFNDYYPHTAYLIYNTNGNVLQWVQNSVASIDEAPALVRLPAGLYSILAQDDDYGRVSVPIVIEGGETTSVHLENRRLPSREQLNASNSVSLPNGRIVGRRARVASP